MRGRSYYVGIGKLATVTTMEKPTACKKIVFEDPSGEWASVHFSSKRQITQFIELLEKMKAGEIDHVHLQDFHEHHCKSEIAFHFPPAKRSQWPHYFKRVYKTRQAVKS